MTINATAEIVTMLRGDSVVAAAVGNVMVYDTSLVAVTGEMDDEWAKSMEPPRRMILVVDAGGPPEVTKNSLTHPRVDIRCYGAEPGGRYDSQELSIVVHDQIFGSADRVRGVCAVTLAAGPTPGREPETNWAYTLRTYDVLAGG